MNSCALVENEWVFKLEQSKFLFRFKDVFFLCLMKQKLKIQWIENEKFCTVY